MIASQNLQLLCLNKQGKVISNVTAISQQKHGKVFRPMKKKAIYADLQASQDMKTVYALTLQSVVHVITNTGKNQWQITNTIHMQNCQYSCQFASRLFIFTDYFFVSFEIQGGIAKFNMQGAHLGVTSILHQAQAASLFPQTAIVFQIDNTDKFVAFSQNTLFVGCTETCQKFYELLTSQQLTDVRFLDQNNFYTLCNGTIQKYTNFVYLSVVGI